MSDLSKFNLAFELLNNVLVFDRNNNIAFAGDSIKKTLSLYDIDIEKIISGKFSDKQGKSLLLAINEVRKDQKSCDFKFAKGDEDFILFPAMNAEKNNVILSLNSKINHINKIEHNLTERVKELGCLYSISDEIQKSKDINEALSKSTEHIKRGFQYPESATVVIEFNGSKYISKDGKEKNIKNTLSDYICKNAKENGQIKVIYHKKLPFLKEEIRLLNEISTKFTRAIEKYNRALVLEKQKKILILKNKKLIELSEECRQTREKLQTFFRAITDKIIVIDSEFNIILSNCDDISTTGKCYENLFHYTEKCKECPAIKTFKTSKIESLEKGFADQFFLLQSYPVFDQNGKVGSVLEVCMDVTKEKRMEQQLIEFYKFASLGKLVTGIAHEINNPNTFILGNIKIIKETFTDILPILDEYYNLNPDLKIARLDYKTLRENIITLIDDIYHGALRMKKIVSDLRSFAKKDEDTFSENVKINDIIENTTRLVKKQIRENVKIYMHLNPNIPVFTGSISKLDQVIVNMILNASQAIDSEKGEIIVNTDFKSADNQVLIVIKDNGKGMDEDTKKNIFDPFFTTKRNEGGIGLGLSISHRIIKEHNGTIDLDTSLGNGTTFTITIPINKMLK